MPIYEYQCQSCGHELEALQKMSDDALSDCPQCEQTELKKMISASAFKLKGSGWYESDFKSTPKSKKPTVNKTETSKSASACATGGCGCH